jgi:Tol biopolymer transport system component
VDRSGRVLSSFGSLKSDIRQPAINRDGNQVAVTRALDKWSIWIEDPLRNTATNLTASLYSASEPAWTSDGRSVVFSCQPFSSSPEGLCRAPADGSGNPRLLVELPEAEPRTPTLSPDDRLALFTTRTTRGGDDIFSVALHAEANPEPFLLSPASERLPQFSPDGHYVAYQSDESGRFEIYVRPFPTGDAKWIISTNGGIAPKWNSSGRELFFVEGEKLMAVPVEIHPTFHPGAPVALFSAREAHVRLTRFTSVALYDPAPGGQRFVAIGNPEGSPRSIVYLQSWFTEQNSKP